MLIGSNLSLMQWYLFCTSEKEISLNKKNLLSAVKIVTELNTLAVLSTRYNGVFCKEPFNRSILKDRSKKGPKKTTMYMIIMIIILIVSLILLSLEEISGGRRYSIC